MQITHIASITLALFFLAACDDAGGGQTTSSTGAGAGGAAATTTNSSATGTGGGGPAVPTCKPVCGDAGDCAQPSPAFDFDNWDCVDAACVYLGCVDAPECQDTFMSANYVCVELDGDTVPTCHPTCSSPFDCAQPTMAFDADNWDCVDSHCEYLGCASTNECQASFASPNYACESLPGDAVPTCHPTCGSPADCATSSAAFDFDNWDCVDSHCIYLGCNSTDECQESLMTANVVCE
jgi:hypothetical protein